ncbi:hypothetical protein GC093_17335 [Paenibacillus sp. LMG 31456]|uniref:DUF4025 domain-containing protein n=1 Tax=Paenibacillus foliorum TaxID=2654974 RepID=A0A972K0S4_9BACL|nr:hypothetical protein [Paenibacillus foliorum]NOU94971.1 hypothetical protein [Paenibacillus foliorum]
MTKNKSDVDKNLQNVVKDFDKQVVNSHQAQQVQQQTNDHRHQDALNHDKPIGGSVLTDKD